MRRSARLIVLAAISGGLTGVAGFAFLWSLDWATRTRIAHGWLVWLLPAAGIVVGFVYSRFGGAANGGTPLVVQQAHLLEGGVPARTAPLVFGATTLAHVVGASVGREGAGLQISGSITDTGARLLHLPDSERQMLLEASLAGGFGAVFGVPYAGVVFAVHLAPRRRILTTCMSAAAAFMGAAVVRWLGRGETHYPHVHPDWTFGLPWKLIVFGLACGVLARAFVWLVHDIKHRSAHFIRFTPLRLAIGGLATLGLMGLFGREYLGLSLPLADKAFGLEHIGLSVPLLKFLFTAVALGFGFVGGEVTPMFIMGATLGAALASGLDAPRLLLVSCGYAAVFASAAGATFSGVVMAIELFGWPVALPALIVGLSARAAAGKTGLYLPPKGRGSASWDGGISAAAARWWRSGRRLRPR